MTSLRRRGRVPLVVSVLMSAASGTAFAAAGGAAGAADPGSCNRAAYRVVVDVGHTDLAPGATSARGVPEYVFNHRLANQIGQRLAGAGFTRTTVLVTPGASWSGLAKRVANANNMGADLFLSIHHDSVPEQFLERWQHEGQPRAYCDRFRGHSIFVSTENAHFQESLAFGRLLGRQLKARGLRYTPHYTEAFMGWKRRELLDPDAGVYRFDQLIVLKNTHMPAVLLEAGSIVNRDEELVLSAPERQAQIGAAVADAVKQFCAAQAATQTPRTARGAGDRRSVRPSASAQPADADR